MHLRRLFTSVLPLALSALLAALSVPQAAAQGVIYTTPGGASGTYTYSAGADVADYNPALNVGALLSIYLDVASGTATERGALVATSSFAKAGAGTLVLAGTLSGDSWVNVNSGTLQVGAGGTSGMVATRVINVSSGATVAFNRSDDVTYTLRFDGTGNVAQNGPGTLTLAGTSDTTYSGFNLTGNLLLNAGTLALGSASAIGTSAKLVFNGGALRWTAANTTDYSARFSTAANQHYRFDTGGLSVTLGATTLASAGGNLTKVGAGTLTLTAANTYDGGTSLNAGTLVVANDSTLGTGTLTLNGGTLATDTARTLANAVALTADSTLGGSQALTLAGAVTLTGASALAIDAGAGPTISGAIGGIGTLNKTGPGTLALTGTNNYSGGTTLTAGTLALGRDSALGSGALSLNGGTLAASGGARAITNAVTLDADSTLGGTQALTLSGNLTLAKNRDLTVTNTALTTISGAIGESGGGRALAKYGAGTLELTGANTYTGGTYIGAGTVRINNSTGSAFGTGAVTVASGATLTGAGSFSGALQNNGTFAPGNSPTLQTLASFNQGSSGILQLELGGLIRGTEYDALNITGSLTFGGTLSVSLINSFSPASGVAFNLFDWGSASGTFATLNLPPLASGLTWDSSALYSSGVISVSAVPEPGTYAALAGAATLAFAAWRRRRR